MKPKKYNLGNVINDCVPPESNDLTHNVVEDIRCSEMISVDRYWLTPNKEDQYPSAAIEVRVDGAFAFKSFYLNPAYDWTIVKDDFSQLCLIPTKKR